MVERKKTPQDFAEQWSKLGYEKGEAAVGLVDSFPSVFCRCF